MKVKLTRDQFVKVHAVCAAMDFREGLAGIVPLEDVVSAADSDALRKEYDEPIKEIEEQPTMLMQTSIQNWLNGLYPNRFKIWVSPPKGRREAGGLGALAPNTSLAKGMFGKNNIQLRRIIKQDDVLMVSASVPALEKLAQGERTYGMGTIDKPLRRGS